MWDTERSPPSCTATTAKHSPPDSARPHGAGAAHEGMKGHRLCEEEPRAKRKVLISLQLEIHPHKFA